MIDEMPEGETLWGVVQEAHDYLEQWINDPSSRVHPTKGWIYFNAGSWGRATKDREACMVCLAGLWYLQKEGRLLGDESRDIPMGGELVVPPIARFLDYLRFPYAKAYHIEKWLGVSADDVRGYKVPGNIWCPDEPTHILDFLDWLLTHRDTNND